MRPQMTNEIWLKQKQKRAQNVIQMTQNQSHFVTNFTPTYFQHTHRKLNIHFSNKNWFYNIKIVPSYAHLALP